MTEHGLDWRNLVPPDRIRQHVHYEAVNPWHPDDTVARAEYLRRAMERILGGGATVFRPQSVHPDVFAELEEFEPPPAVAEKADVCPRCGAAVIQQVFGPGCTDLDCGWNG